MSFLSFECCNPQCVSLISCRSLSNAAVQSLFSYPAAVFRMLLPNNFILVFCRCHLLRASFFTALAAFSSLKRDATNNRHAGAQCTHVHANTQMGCPVRFSSKGPSSKSLDRRFPLSLAKSASFLTSSEVSHERYIRMLIPPRCSAEL